MTWAKPSLRLRGSVTRRGQGAVRTPARRSARSVRSKIDITRSKREGRLPRRGGRRSCALAYCARAFARAASACGLRALDSKRDALHMQAALGYGLASSGVNVFYMFP